MTAVIPAAIAALTPRSLSSNATQSAGLNPSRAGLDIKVLTPPIFVATKLEAFRGRGNNDLYASRDAEDLLLMVDGREELLAEISAASDDVRQFTAEGFRALLANIDFDDFLEGNLREQPGRPAIVKARYVAISQCDVQNEG